MSVCDATRGTKFEEVLISSSRSYLSTSHHRQGKVIGENQSGPFLFFSRRKQTKKAIALNGPNS